MITLGNRRLFMGGFHDHWSSTNADNPALVPGCRAKPGNVAIGGQDLTVEPWARGLIYELRLPWSELAPAQPAAGLRMGAYFIMFNNDGEGLVDTLQWPRPIDGLWLVPRRWGVVNLT
jgi:hypothetical protein